MTLRFACVVLLIGLAGAAWAEPKIDRAVVTVGKHNGRDWCTLDSQVSDTVPLSVSQLITVIQDYDAYPRLFPRLHEVNARTVPGATLLSETVVVEALGIRNVNRFTLRVTKAQDTPLVVSWTQESTDGSIDGLEGAWVLEERGTVERPLTNVTYRTKMSVPVVVFGQDIFLRLFLGSETRTVVETVVKAAASH